MDKSTLKRRARTCQALSTFHNLQNHWFWGTLYIILTSFSQPNGLFYYLGGSQLNAILWTVCSHWAHSWGRALLYPCHTEGQDLGDRAVAWLRHSPSWARAGAHFALEREKMTCLLLWHFSNSSRVSTQDLNVSLSLFEHLSQGDLCDIV